MPRSHQQNSDSSCWGVTWGSKVSEAPPVILMCRLSLKTLYLQRSVSFPTLCLLFPKLILPFSFSYFSHDLMSRLPHHLSSVNMLYFIGVNPHTKNLPVLQWSAQCRINLPWWFLTISRMNCLRVWITMWHWQHIVSLQSTKALNSFSCELTLNHESSTQMYKGNFLNFQFIFYHFVSLLSFVLSC